MTSVENFFLSYKKSNSFNEMVTLFYFSVKLFYF